MSKILKVKNMNHLRLVTLLFAACIISVNSSAQQVPMYSQYIMNGFLVNPSLAGRDGLTTVNLTVREQWVGLANAPSTYAASFQTRILKNSYISRSTSVKKKIVRPTKSGRVGIGGYLFNDNNGIMRRTGIQATYAYHIPMGEKNGDANDLAFGLAVTAYQFAIDTKGLIYDPDDQYLNNYDRSVFIPDFNFGVSYSTSNYYLGFAMTNLLRGSVVFGDASEDGRSPEVGHYFLTGGIKVPLTADWVLEPSAFIKSSDLLMSSIQLDLTSRIYYKENYWAGISWRTEDAIIPMIGIKFDRFYFAYAFDFTLTDIRKQSQGSHEVTLAVRFGESARRYRWINAY
jgi:type IX secretion system PorP/SprF family membrane protein